MPRRPPAFVGIQAMNRFLSRRPLAFSLRTLMVLVALCAVATWFARGRWIAGQRRSIIERHWAGGFDGILIYERPAEYLPRRVKFFGDTVVNEIQIYEWASPQDVAEVRHAFPDAPARWYKERSPRRWIVTKEIFPSSDPAEIAVARAWLASPQAPVQAHTPPR
jgi:hypothetical protein